MKTACHKGISVKLFAGIHLTSEIKLHLQNSIAWKQAKIDHQMHHNELVEIHYHEKEYLGLLLDNAQLSLLELRAIEISIQDKLKTYCPNLNLSFNILLLPQTLIS